MKTTRHLVTMLLVAFLANASAFAKQYAVIATSSGPITIELDVEKAPISVKNFEAYAKDGFYAGTVFHRVMPGFMIQGGGFDFHGDYPDGLHDKGVHGGMRDPIVNEWTNGLKNTRGSVAMARLGGQADSATSQFFINLADNDFLDTPRDGAGYAVFGRVVAGMDVVDAIAAVPTETAGRLQNVPSSPVMIEGVSIFQTEADAAKAAKSVAITAAKSRVEAAEKGLEAAKRTLEEAKQALEEAEKRGREDA